MAIGDTGGGWIDPKVTRSLLRQAHAYQKASERNRDGLLKAKEAALHAYLERAYSAITGKPMPSVEDLSDRLDATSRDEPNHAAANAIAVYLAVVAMDDRGAMRAALESMDAAFMRMRIEVAERDDEEAILLLI